mmetsp:Transcript_49670/g.98875  ORF Transcript_49670/g.98875 Transcript_49670/m.98875 type:complete len:194 (+) Transcript_49670:774-1355(+)
MRTPRLSASAKASAARFALSATISSPMARARVTIATATTAFPTPEPMSTLQWAFTMYVISAHPCSSPCKREPGIRMHVTTHSRPCQGCSKLHCSAQHILIAQRVHARGAGYIRCQLHSLFLASAHRILSIPAAFALPPFLICSAQRCQKLQDPLEAQLPVGESNLVCGMYIYATPPGSSTSRGSEQPGMCVGR